MKEKWKEIEEFPNYKISNTGKVYSINIDKIKGTRFKNGYELVRLSKNDKIYERFVARLVAIAFIPNPENKKEVNHIDEIKSNNMVTNLEWSTPKENVNHGTRNTRVRKKIGYPVVQKTMEGEIIKIYESINQTQQFGFSFSQVAKVCRGLYTHHKNFKWEYLKK